MGLPGNRSRCVVVTALSLSLGIGPAWADTAIFFATLSGSSEVPPNSSAGTGTASLVVDTDTLVANYSLAFAGLSGTQTSAHFHHAPPGVIGVVEFPLPVGSPVSGTWAMTAAQYGELVDGAIYVNVHTSAYPGGEIRGQMALAQVVGTESSTFGAVKTLFR